ncbi:MAG: hypothetical protein C5B60_09165 [Chloroflexi bacterium]|nr:MAG: hypothetical protein C5B60_09165 [Chloroflexota bacterium]
MKAFSDLAWPGSFEDRATRELAEQRARTNAACYREAGMRLVLPENLGRFFRGLAARPERIVAGPMSTWGIEVDPNVRAVFDHIRCYNRNGRPFAVIFHPYTRLNLAIMKALVDWTSDVGVNLLVDADSEHFPGVSLRVVLYREGETFPKTDLA